MFDKVHMPVIGNTVFLLSLFESVIAAVRLLIGDNKYNEFLAIPALNNPRAGFARCKENNHV